MTKGTIPIGLSLFVAGAVLGIYASRRNCLIALLTRGEMNFWTGMQILAGFIALAGLIIASISGGEGDRSHFGGG